MGSDVTGTHQDRDLVIGVLQPECSLHLGLVYAMPQQAAGDGRHGEGLRRRCRIGAQVGEGKRTVGMVRRAGEVSPGDHGVDQAELDRQLQARVVPGVAERLLQRSDRLVEAVLVVVNFPQQPERTGPEQALRLLGQHRLEQLAALTQLAGVKAVLGRLDRAPLTIKAPVRRRQDPGVLGQVSGNLRRAPPPGVVGGGVQRTGHPLLGSLRPQRPVAGLLLDASDQRDKPAVHQATLARRRRGVQARREQRMGEADLGPLQSDDPGRHGGFDGILGRGARAGRRADQLHGGRGRHSGYEQGLPGPPRQAR